MNYQEAMAFLEETKKYGSQLGLTSITNLMKELGDVQEKVPVVHIAGTNGKGSTGAMLASVLRESGYKTGHFSTPDVFSYEEEFRINGTLIEKQRLAEVFTEVADRGAAFMVSDRASCPGAFSDSHTASHSLRRRRAACKTCLSPGFPSVPCFRIWDLHSPLRAALRLSSGGKAVRRLFPSGKNLTKRSPVSPGLLLPSQSHVPSWLCQTAASGWHQFRSASAFCLPSGSPSVLSGTKAVPASNWRTKDFRSRPPGNCTCLSGVHSFILRRNHGSYRRLYDDVFHLCPVDSAAFHSSRPPPGPCCRSSGNDHRNPSDLHGISKIHSCCPCAVCCCLWRDLRDFSDKKCPF